MHLISRHLKVRLLEGIIAVVFFLPFLSQAQCNFPVGFNTSYCVDDAAVVLTGGTNYYGPGVSGNIFTPAIAGVGTHRVFTTDGSTASYISNSSGSFNPYLLSSPTQIFPANNSFQDVPLGFNFNFYGTTYSSARVFDNAFIRLTTDTDGNPLAQLIPNASNPNNLIAAAWSDLDPATGIIQYQTIGTAPLRVLVIDYINVRFVSTPSQFVTTQIQLYETSNIIEIHSTQIGTDATDLKTMGIENSDGSLATAAPGRNKSSWTANNDFVAFIPSCTDRRFVSVSGLPDNSLTITPTATTICENGTVSVTVQNSQIGVSYQLRNDATNAILSGTVLGNSGNITLNSFAIPTSLDIKIRAVNLTTLCDQELLNEVSVTVNLFPTTANAGANQNVCGLITTLSGNLPATGTGLWSKVSGPGAITFSATDATTPGASATASAYGTYVLRWAITNGVCPSSFSNVTINFFETPSTPLAGLDIAQCNNGTFTMGANTPLVGVGNWTVVSGIATPITPASPTSQVAGVPASTSATLRWTISNGSCGSLFEDVIITNNSSPTPFIFGSNSVCENQIGLIYSAPPSGNTYLWAITGGTITSSNNTSSIVVTWNTAGTGTLQLTETNPTTLCAATTAPFNVTINAIPIPSFTGPNVACSNQAGLVYTTTPTTGHNYAWNISGGTITSGGGSSTITVTWGSSGLGTVQLTETIAATGCAASTLNIPVTINARPTPFISGPNSVCSAQSGLTYTTAGTTNDYIWTIVGGTITSGSGTSSIIVTWDPIGPATLQLVESDLTTGCSATTSLFPVAININPTPAIGGLPNVCANQTGVTYSTAPASGRSYLWAVSGGTITSGGGSNSITVTWGSSSSGTVQLTESISATGCSASTPDYPVTINPPPSPIIAGVNSVCPNQAGVNYSIPASGNSYSWSIVGGTITSGNGTSNIVVTWNATGPASLQVIETSVISPFCSAPSPVFNVTINPSPTPNIGGTVNSCANKTGVNYNTASVAGHTYAWTITGGTITAGVLTNSITVTWGTTGTGKLKVTETITLTGCSVTTPDYLVNINPLPTPNISGPNSTCAFTNNLIYATSLNAGNTYLWVVSAGGTIVGPNNNNSVTINWGAAGARTVRVTETISATGCFVQTPNYNVTVANPTPVISGPVNVCSNQTSVAYSTPTAAGRSYVWTVTNGTIASGTGTASITINWGPTGPGQIQLTETIIATGCFVTTPIYNVNINPVPAPNITGLLSVCGNQSNVIYTTPSVAGNSYAWSVAGGGIFSGGGTNSISVTFGPTGTGVVSLIQTITATGCATSTAINVAIASPAPVVSGLTTVCPNQANVNYSTTNNTGNTFNWIVVGGSLASGAGTNSVNINWGSTGLGAIFLTETITSSGCSTSISPYFVTIVTGPSVQAGSDAETCEGIAFNFSIQTTPASAANYGSIGWTTTGSGTLTNANTFAPSYSPGTGESGAKVFTLTATSLSSCQDVTDQMILIITPLPIVNAGGDLATCQGSSIDFVNQMPAATALNHGALQWTTSGSGTLFNTNTFAPTYIPSSGETGVKTFTLSTVGNGACSSSNASDVMQLNILPTPVVNAGSDAETCKGFAINFSSQLIQANATNYSSILWTTTGLGILTGATTFSPTYQPLPSETNAITFTLTAFGNGGVCAFVQDDMILSITPPVVVDAGSNAQACQSPLFNFNAQSLPATTSNNSSLLWTHGGTGLLFNATTLAPTYFLGPGETGNVIFTLTAHSIGSCSDQIDVMTVSFIPAPIANAGSNAKICDGVPSFNFGLRTQTASIANGTLLWSHNGTGSLSNANILNPVYSVGPGDAGNTVTFTLAVTDVTSVCPPAIDQFDLIINTLPVVVFSGLPAVMSEKKPPIILSGNQIGGLFTILPVTSNIGSTVQSPVDIVSFDPAAVTLGVNTITYTFTNANGCTNFDTKSVSVNPVTVIDFSIQYQNGSPPYPFASSDGAGGFELCAGVGLVKIVGTPAASTGILPTNFVAVGPNATNITISTSMGEYYINTDGLPSDTYHIQYNYTNSIGTPSPPLVKAVKIFASPQPVISVLNNCVVSAIQFNGSYTLPPTAYPPNSETWLWSFGTGEGLSIDQNPLHIYPNSGVKNISLVITTSQGCSATRYQSVNVGDVPVVDFDWSSICTSDTTKYLDKTNVGSFSTITQYTWDFGDGDMISGFAGTIPANTHGGRTVGSYKNPKHKFVSSGTYQTKLTIDTDTGCSNSIIQDVFILPAGSTTKPSSGTPYTMDFETTDGGWIPQGLKINVPPSTSPISWEWGSPSGATIISASSGTKAWWTGNNVNSYFPSEQSALNGPCFDLTLLTRPMLALDYWSDTDNNLDGAVLQYSIDGGLIWKIVGPPEGQPDRDEGINWFNGQGIPSNPGLQPFGNYGWTGKTNQWKNARFNLDMVPFAQRKQVRLRIGFGSNTDNAPGETFDGFAMDNFFVGEKKRNTLVEHFTNSNDPSGNSIAGDNYINNLYQDQITFRGKSDFFDIQYHINIPKADAENTANPSDPAGRSLYYGVSKPPTTIMDGIVDGIKFKGNYAELNRVEIDRRALKDPPFDLQLVEIPTATNNVISVKLTITALQNFNSPLIAQVALIENQVGTSKNVLRKQLFGSDGETITLQLNQGDVIFKSRDAIEINVAVTNPNGLTLVGYVQDKNTKEIYQSVILAASPKQGAVVTALLDDSPIEDLNSISVYPNPAKGHFFFGFPKGYRSEELLWSMIDQHGVTIASGNFITGDLVKRVEIDNLANGLYFVKVEGKGNRRFYKKLVVLNGR